MKTINLPNGTAIPLLGQGTWKMGDNKGKEAEEIAALQEGIALGMTLLDTAEMYGEGRSERLIGKAIAPFSRQDLYLVSKVYPHNAGKQNLEKSLDQSLKNLNTSYLDLYLLHWRGSIPMEETIEAMETQVAKGKIKGWGVSNFDTPHMKALLSLPQGNHCQVNQVMFHLGSRGVEYDLLPYLKEQNIPLMAYCPLAQGNKERLLGQSGVQQLAEKYQVTAMTILLAFVLQTEGVFAIPKASSPDHVRENHKALSLQFTQEDWEILNKAFPKPSRKTELDML